MNRLAIPAILKNSHTILILYKDDSDNIVEPQTVQEALNNPQAYQAMRELSTCFSCDLPPKKLVFQGEMLLKTTKVTLKRLLLHWLGLLFDTIAVAIIY